MSANTSTKSSASSEADLERRLADLEERERKVSERERAAAGASGLRRNLYGRITLSTRDLVKHYPVRRAGNSLDRPVPVTTFLFELPEQPQIRLQTSEISCHEWLDLEYIADRENIIRRPMSPRCPDVLFPCLPATDGFVWGFTYETLMMVIADRYDALPRTITAEPRR